MNTSVSNPSDLFRELSRFCDGDHTLYLRTDSQTFVELHRNGPTSVFTSPVAALIPNVVIKLQTPLVPSIISAVPSEQGCRVLHSQSRLYVVESLADIVGLVNHHKAAFIREDTTLAVWAQDVPLALASLYHVQKELDVLLGRHDTARAVDHNPFYGEFALDASPAVDSFDQYIHGYELSTLGAEKNQESSALFQLARNSLPPLGMLGVETLDSLYPFHRMHLFDALSPVSNGPSPMLGDSPAALLASAMFADMSGLHINNTPESSPSPAFSFTNLAFTFSSPSSSGSFSDSALSTPLTIAPSALSSPHPWNCTPLSDNLALPTIAEASVEDVIQDEPVNYAPDSLVGSETPLPSSLENVMDSPSKRKRSAKAKADGPQPVVARATVLSESPRLRRSTRAVAAPKPPASPPSYTKKAATKQTRTCIVPATPKKTLCPLPGRSVKSTRGLATGASLPLRAAKTSFAARLTTKRVTTAACCDDECEHVNLNEELDSDVDSEYDADGGSEDDDDEEEYRPSKRSRSATTPPTSTVSSASSATSSRRKAVSPKIATSKKTTGKTTSKKTKSKKKDVLAQPLPKPPKAQCVWCDGWFSRESDVLRHELKSCKWYPFDQEREYCPDCGKDISREDAVLRHMGSGKCHTLQRENAKRKEKED